MLATKRPNAARPQRKAGTPHALDCDGTTPLFFHVLLVSDAVELIPTALAGKAGTCTRSPKLHPLDCVVPPQTRKRNGSEVRRMALAPTLVAVPTRPTPGPQVCRQISTCQPADGC